MEPGNRQALDDGMLTVTQAAALTGTHPRLIRRLCASGHITATLVGKTWVMDEAQVAKIQDRPKAGRRKK